MNANFENNAAQRGAMPRGDLLNDEQAAAFLQIKRRTLRQWRERRGLPHFKPSSKCLYYRAGDLMAWLEKFRAGAC